jgi:NAD+ synthetase
MRIGLAQINPRVGDLENNTHRILAFVRRALEERADLVVFPEMGVLGYPPQDLLEKKTFVAKVQEKIREIALASMHIGIICGYVSENKAPSGKPLHNSAALCFGGRIAATVNKSLLPTYDVFDERRYFEPASCVAPVEFGDRKIGLSICEDIWNDRAFWPHLLYAADPVEDLVKQGAELIINIAASPFAIGRPQFKERMIAATARRHGRPVIAVNQVGGNTSLLFEGASKCFNAKGEVVARAKHFEEDFIVFDTDKEAGFLRVEPANDTAMVYDALVMGTRDYVHKCGFRKAVIGLSGGIDSSLVAKIAADALGAENVLGVSMPSRYSSEHSKSDAAALARNIGIEMRTVTIEPTFKSYLASLAGIFKGKEPDVTEENIQARVRGNILMAISNKFGHLVLTTGNKSELAVGYCTLYGDMSGGLAVIGDVPKTMIYEIARHLNREKEIIPPAVLTKAPSAELRPNQTDQDTLPPYDVLDAILKLYVEENMEHDEIAAKGFNPQLVEKVLRMVDHNEYKRTQAAPCLRITTKAFGVGRRIPIVQGWR